MELCQPHPGRDLQPHGGIHSPVWGFPSVWKYPWPHRRPTSPWSDPYPYGQTPDPTGALSAPERTCRPGEVSPFLWRVPQPHGGTPIPKGGPPSPRKDPVPTGGLPSPRKDPQPHGGSPTPMEGPLSPACPRRPRSLCHAGKPGAWPGWGVVSGGKVATVAAVTRLSRE